MIEIQAEKELPSGWQWVKLGDVCSAIRGVTFPSTETSPLPFADSIACLTTSAVQQEVDWSTKRYISRNYISNSSQLLANNDILVSTANSKALVGKSCFVKEPEEPSTFGAFVTVLRANENVLPQILFSWMRSSDSKEFFFEKSANTTNISNLKVSDLLEHRIPLPPLAEQKRIASILTEKMSTVENAKAVAEARLRAAKELPAAYLKEVFESEEAQGWNTTRMDNIAYLIIDGPHITPNYQPSGVPFLTIRNMVTRKIDMKNVSYVSEADHLQFSSRGKAEKGDILYSKDGTLGIPCLVTIDDEFSYFVSVALIKLNKGMVDPQYVSFALESPHVLAQVRRLGEGAGLKHMVLRSIRSLEIKIPPIDVQKRIAMMLEENRQSVAALTHKINEELTAIKSLPTAILRQAFVGEL